MQIAPALPDDRSSEVVDLQGEYVISICNDALDFVRLRSEWEALRQKSKEQDPFLSADWFATWWRAFGDHRKLFLVTVRRHGQLCAVLPLMLERIWRHGIPLRRLAAIVNDHTPRFDLVRADDDGHLHRPIWDFLMTLQDQWDVLEFPRLSTDSITTECFIKLADERGLQYSRWQRAPRSPWIEIQPCWQDYLDSRSAGFRKALRRKMRRLAERGKVGLDTVTGCDALGQALADGLHLEAEGWKGANKTAISSQSQDKAFYSELAEIMATRGQLRLHFLTLDDARIAFDYSIFANGCLYSLKAGHSSAHARLSPGTLMLSLILQQAHDEGLIGVDLLGDSDDFKMHWTDVTRRHEWLHCYSDSIPGRLLHVIKCRLLPMVRGR